MAWPLLGFNVATFVVGKGIDIWVVGALASQQDVACTGRPRSSSSTSRRLSSSPRRSSRRSSRSSGPRERSASSSTPCGRSDAGGRCPPLWCSCSSCSPGRRSCSSCTARRSTGREPVLAVLSIARLYAVVTGNSGIALQMTGFQRTLLYLTFFSGACSLAAEIVFGRLYGLIGVACSTAAAQVLQNSLQLYYAQAEARHLDPGRAVAAAVHRADEADGVGRCRPRPPASCSGRPPPGAATASAAPSCGPPRRCSRTPRRRGSRSSSSGRPGPGRRCSWTCWTGRPRSSRSRAAASSCGRCSTPSRGRAGVARRRARGDHAAGAPRRATGRSTGCAAGRATWTSSPGTACAASTCTSCSPTRGSWPSTATAGRRSRR